jgi:hypothetical protein
VRPGSAAAAIALATLAIRSAAGRDILEVMAYVLLLFIPLSLATQQGVYRQPVRAGEIRPGDQPLLQRRQGWTSGRASLIQAARDPCHADCRKADPDSAARDLLTDERTTLMFRLYYAPGTCALATHIALEEAGAPYERPVRY